MWMGHIATRDTGHQKSLFLVPVDLGPQVVYVRPANVDLSEHNFLRVPEDARRSKEHVPVIKVSSDFALALPEWLGDLTRPVKINLECSRLTVLPKRLGDLKGLKKLDLAGCSGVMGLPEQL